MDVVSQDRGEARAGAITPVTWLLPPLAAAIYPFPLMSFHQAVPAAADGSVLAIAIAAISLALAFAVPLLALAVSVPLFRLTSPTAAVLLARRVAIFAVAAPPLFTLIGVVCFLAGVSAIDKWVLAVFWGGLAIAIARSDNQRPVTLQERAPLVRLRWAHGIVALGFIVTYLSLHLGNHLLGLAGNDTHVAVMKVLRLFYRSTVFEPLLIAGTVFLIGSGLVMAWRQTERPCDGFRAFQIASGVYLAVAITSHLNAVLYLARIHLHIESDWSFGIGAPAGLIRDAWNIRLVPYYLLAVVAVIAHPFAGMRIVALAHGTRRRLADGLVLWGTAFAVLVAIVIMLAMCGMRVNFSGT